MSVTQSIEQTIAQVAEIQKRLLTTASYECYNSTIMRPNINLPDGLSSPSLYLTTNMWVHMNVTPSGCDTELFMNAFAGNPKNPSDRKRIVDIARWYQIAQEYMETFVVLHSTLINKHNIPVNTLNKFAMNNRLRQIREYRTRVDELIMSHTLIERKSSLFHEGDIRAETQILSHMNRLPDDLVNQIASFIPDDIMCHIYIPTSKEIDITLQCLPIAGLRKLYNHLVVSRYNNLEEDNIFLFGITYRVISVDLYHHFMSTDWGRHPITKEQHIHEIVSLFRFYCYVHNIYLYKSRVNHFTLNAVLQTILQTDTIIIRNEITYIFKLTRYLAKRHSKLL